MTVISTEFDNAQPRTITTYHLHLDTIDVGTGFTDHVHRTLVDTENHDHVQSCAVAPRNTSSVLMSSTIDEGRTIIIPDKSQYRQGTANRLMKVEKLTFSLNKYRTRHTRNRNSWSNCQKSVPHRRPVNDPVMSDLERIWAHIAVPNKTNALY